MKNQNQTLFMVGSWLRPKDFGFNIQTFFVGGAQHFLGKNMWGKKNCYEQIVMNKLDFCFFLYCTARQQTAQKASY